MITPSFMTSAQALQMDNNKFKKSFGKDVSVKYVKCNNINVNVNGLELDINDFPPGLLGADAAETEASDLASGMGGSSNGPSGFDNEGFVFVCINNNNNAGRDDNDDVEKCETCFRTVLTPDELADLIENFELEGVDSLQDICNFIDENIGTEVGRILISKTLFSSLNAQVSPDNFFEIIECLDDVYNVVIPT